MPRILILTHPNDRFTQIHYMLREIAACWREAGIEVDVQTGADFAENYDAAILHVDLTRVPDDFLAAAQCFPLLLNGKVGDISKQVISRNRVQRHDAYEGPVIVKTDLNSGGMMEGRRVRREGGVAKLGYKLRQRLPWQFRSVLDEYPIFVSASEVPGAVWRNQHLIVERFRPERSGEFYCLRSWVFLGDQETNSISYSRCAVIKSHNVERRESVAEIPAELRQIRRELHFDFGKFDYALVDGEVVLYDANRTPTLGSSHEQVVKNMEILAKGIHWYWPLATESKENPQRNVNMPRKIS